MPVRGNRIQESSITRWTTWASGPRKSFTSAIPRRRIWRGPRMWGSVPSCWIGHASHFAMPWNGSEPAPRENDLAKPAPGSYFGARQSRFIHARIAQSVEQLAFNQLVLGSSPSPRTSPIPSATADRGDFPCFRFGGLCIKVLGVSPFIPFAPCGSRKRGPFSNQLAGRVLR